MWKLLKAVDIPLRVAAVIALVYLAYVFIARRTSGEHWENSNKGGSEPNAEQQAKFDATYGGSAVKVLQFFARDGALTEGQETVLCYGVVNAKSVKVEPAVAGVIPAVNKCVSVQPEHDTTYTMTAEGDNGQTATAAVTVTVQADAETLPKITSFEVIKHSEEQGKHFFTIGFRFVNGNTVSIEPPVFRPLEDSAPFGQVTVSPAATTTYTLTVTGKKGRKASKRLTVEVPKS